MTGRVAVVIVTYNSADVLEGCLESLTAGAAGVERIVTRWDGAAFARHLERPFARRVEARRAGGGECAIPDWRCPA